MESKEKAKKKHEDGADYLFKTTKYHDRRITVRDPNTKKMETIGVSTLHLVSHSTVFREVLSKSQNRTGKNTHITDVTPEVFKLMLRYVYGGELPKMSQESAAQLALCADKYNIQPLVAKAAAMLVPTTVQDVFPALRFVVYLNVPDLEKRVVTIIQQQTDKVIAHKEFLTLDVNCLEFITKQERLAVPELGLWKGLVKWAKRQTNDPKKMRKILERPLLHVRFLTLTQDEVVKEVMPLKIFTPLEITDLLSAITYQLTLKSSGFSSSKKFRNSPILKKTRQAFYSVLRYQRESHPQLVKGCQLASSFTIESVLNKDIDILSLTCTTKSAKPYKLKVSIAVHAYVDGYLRNTHLISVTVFAGKNLVIPMKLKDGRYPILKPSVLYLVVLDFSCSHPVFSSWIIRNGFKTNTTTEEKCDANKAFRVRFRTPFHVKKIDFMY